MNDFLLKYKTPLLTVLLLPVMYFPIFLHLDYLPLRQWDESIMGVNAVEMMQNHNWLVTYFGLAPDHSNCKPPLMIWLIVFFSKLIGFGELSVRLPSALAAVALCLWLFFVLKKYTGSAVYGFFVVMVLLTCNGYVRNHVIRTGEYDSLLTLFSTIFSLHFFFAVEAENDQKRSRPLLLFFIFLTLAVLTKGIAPVMQAPGLFLYALIRKKVWVFLKSKAFYFGIGIFLAFGVSYYFIREAISPGYLEAVWVNELGGRYGTVNEGHVGPWNFYLNELWEWQFVEYLAIFPLALILGLTLGEGKMRKLVIYACVAGGMFLVVVSSSATKLSHYDAPVFPYLAIITGYFFYFIYSSLKEFLSKTLAQGYSKAVAFFCVLVLTAWPYSNIISKVYFPKGDYWEEGFTTACRYFQEAGKGRIDPRGKKPVFVAQLNKGEMSVLKCYAYHLEQKGMNISFATPENAATGDTLVIFDGWHKYLIGQKFQVQQIAYLDKCNGSVLVVGALKN